MKQPPILAAVDIAAYHDRTVAEAPVPDDDAAFGEGAWHWIETNHRCNRLLWDEEDQARRRDVPDSFIAANKRAIDRYNQLRNDAVERLDEQILATLAGVTPLPGAWHNAETAGAMVDRLSILALKIHHMRKQAERPDASAEHRAMCGAKLAQLETQRSNLIRCLDALLEGCASGNAFYRIYRQFKMYNDPATNPYLQGAPPER
jgi:hypothetical protein